MVKMTVLSSSRGSYIKIAGCSPLSVVAVERNICNSCPCETQRCIRMLCGARRGLYSQRSTGHSVPGDLWGWTDALKMLRQSRKSPYGQEG